LNKFEIRQVDCIDCHNRPSHKYNPPELFINSAITAGNISKEIPDIKSVAVEACQKEYSTTDTALIAISSEIKNYYSENYPEFLATNSLLIDKAISSIQMQFSKNIFPEMKVRWDKYPVNIGHIKTMGCFRCHDDNHVSKSGKIISKDCNLCHLINSQGEPGNLVKTSIGEGLEFIHPGEDITKDDWEESFCSDCHEGNGP
jgi:hypothetical protein